MSTPDTFEKLMSISHSEFLASLVHVGATTEAPGGNWSVALDGGGTANIHFHSLSGVRLGGLLELPRARVSISFNDGSEAARDAFMQRFELAFQRGGG